MPQELVLAVHLGSRVRVPLHGRRVGGWVVALDPPDLSFELDRIRPIAKVSSRGPDGGLIELARWASTRWAAGRLRPFLVTASPPSNVAGLPPNRRTGARPQPASAAAARLLATGGGMLRWPPNDDLLPVLLAAAARGPLLVVAPSPDRARLDAARLRRAGLSVAIYPHDWAAAAGGVDVVIGSRAAAWAPCADLAAAVVVDEHDEALQEERAPTWHARDVLAGTGEAGGRAGAARVAEPDPHRCGRGRRAGGSTGDRRRAGELAARRGRRSQPRRAVEDVARDVAAHRPPAGRRPHRGVRAQHPGRARILACRTCKAVGPLRAVRGGRRPGRRRHPALSPLRRGAPGRLPRVRGIGVRQPQAGRDAAARGGGGGRRASRRGRHRSRGRAARSSRGLRRHRGGVASGAARRRRGVPRHRQRAAGAALPGGRAGDGAARARRPAGRAARRGRSSAGADVPAPPRGGPGGAAR